MSTYEKMVIADAAMAYYRLDEISGTVAHDSSGNGYDATVSGAAGANAGTSPPSPVLTGCTDIAGKITFGTGTTPAAGDQVDITFNTTYSSAPKVVASPLNSASAALNLYVTSTTTGFSVSCVNAPSGSQANTVYGFFYHVFV